MSAKLKNKGFILLEVLISIIIITVVLITINRGFSASLRAVNLAGDYLLAGCVLEDKIFDIQIHETFPEDESDLAFSDTVTLGEDEFIYSLELKAAEINNNKELTQQLPLKEAILTVNSPRYSDTEGLKVITYVREQD